jgi:hypothetical protein
MRVPRKVLADSFVKDNHPTVQSKKNKGIWYIAKPLSFRGLFLVTRLKLAWSVFIGKNDVLTYIEE